MGKLDGNIAIITGSARGIGREMALCFAREGANIVISDVLTSEMEATAQDIRKLGRETIAIKIDVSKKQDVEQMINLTIERFGRVDILVNNAAILASFTPLIEMSEDEWDKMIDVNLKGSFLCIQAAARHMIKQKYGKIINIASIVGLGMADEGVANYASAKAGVVQLTKSSAGELGPYGINVNAIAPGLIVHDTVYKRRTPEQAEKYIEDRKKKAVLGRAGIPQDIANLALFLASDDSSFITGQVIAADGGRHDLMG